MPQHAVFKIGSSLLFHYKLLYMVQHVALSPAGMYQGRGQINKSKEDKESIVKPLWIQHDALCSEGSYKMYVSKELCQSGSLQSYKNVWKFHLPRLLQGREIEK